MDIFTSLNPETQYSSGKLQLIFGAWVATALFEDGGKVDLGSGDVVEDDYTKQSIYALLYSVYREIGTVNNPHGEPYEFTFNTWGYDWPEGWGDAPTRDADPQRFGKNAYTGLFQFDAVQAHASAVDGKVHIVEMGCGTGAGAHHICKEVWPDCTYVAVDMQGAAIQTCKRKFVPELGGRLTALHGDATKLDLKEGSADFVVICETHVTEYAGVVTEEDKRFFSQVLSTLKPGGFLVWGNAIPEVTWQPCFDYLESIGMKQVGGHDVTSEAVQARDLDLPRTKAYVAACLDKFYGFRIPVLGKKRADQAELALKNFFRHPGTNLYQNMVDGTDTYRVVLEPELTSELSALATGDVHSKGAVSASTPPCRPSARVEAAVRLLVALGRSRHCGHRTRTATLCPHVVIMTGHVGIRLMESLVVDCTFARPRALRTWFGGLMSARSLVVLLALGACVQVPDGSDRPVDSWGVDAPTLAESMPSSLPVTQAPPVSQTLVLSVTATTPGQPVTWRVEGLDANESVVIARGMGAWARDPVLAWRAGSVWRSPTRCFGSPL
jgi:SAM-dependent methyltransferase